MRRILPKFDPAACGAGGPIGKSPLKRNFLGEVGPAGLGSIFSRN